MSFLNARGGYLKIDVVSSSDLTKSCTLQNDGTPVDISGGSISTVVKDKGRGIVATVGQPITDGSNGEWTLLIPKSVFKDWEGEEMSYETYLTLASVETQLLWGELDIYETV